MTPNTESRTFESKSLQIFLLAEMRENLYHRMKGSYSNLLSSEIVSYLDISKENQNSEV